MNLQQRVLENKNARIAVIKGTKFKVNKAFAIEV